jgi:drug/metabolite transporter (DMT)-like permease
VLGIGIAAALTSCALWAWSATNFQLGVQRWGAFTCNLFKTVVACLFFGVTILVKHALGDAGFGGLEDILWLALSGFVGMALGDWALLASVERVGVRQAMLIHGTAPLFLLIRSWTGKGDPLTTFQVVGVLLVVTGVGTVTWLQGRGGALRPVGFAMGIFFGLVAALGQAGGIVIAKYSIADFDLLTASGTRLAGALVGLLLVQAFRLRLRRSVTALKVPDLWRSLTIPAFVGTYLGIILMMTAINFSPEAVSGALLATTPLFVIPCAVWMLGETFQSRVLVGTAIAVAGIALISMQ